MDIIKDYFRLIFGASSVIMERGKSWKTCDPGNITKNMIGKYVKLSDYK